MLLTTLVSCEWNLPRYREVSQFFIRIEEVDLDVFEVRCFKRQYDFNTLKGTTDAVLVDPLECNNLKGYDEWDSYIVPRSIYIKSKIKRIIVK